VNETGDIAASATRSVQTQILPASGAEQDPNEIWGAVLSAIKQVLREAGKPRDAVAGITCASQYFSLVPVDRDVRPVMNLIVWMDGRGGRYALELYERHPTALETWVDRHGMVPLPSGNDSLSHLLYVQHECPAVYERTYKFLEPMDFLIAKLTGTCSANLCTAFPLARPTGRTRCCRPARKNARFTSCW